MKEDADVAAVIKEADNVAAAKASTQPQEDSDDDDPPSPPPSPEPMPSHQIPRDKQDAPTDKAQRNFTDADSRIMKTGDGFVQGYNAQIAVDELAQVIVALGVSNQSPDCEHFIPVLDRIVENCGRPPEKASADNGYFSEGNVVRATNRGIDVYIAPGRIKHGKDGEAIAVPDDDSVKARMKAKLATDEGHAVYSRRKVIVEPVFGQIKKPRLPPVPAPRSREGAW